MKTIGGTVEIPVPMTTPAIINFNKKVFVMLMQDHSEYGHTKLNCLHRDHPLAWDLIARIRAKIESFESRGDHVIIAQAKATV